MRRNNVREGTRHWGVFFPHCLPLRNAELELIGGEALLLLTHLSLWGLSGSIQKDELLQCLTETG